MTHEMHDLTPRSAGADGRIWLNAAALARPAAPCVFFVHGAYHGAWCWADWMRALAAENRPAAAVDLPGHGGFPQPPDFAELGVLDFAAAVERCALSLERPLLGIGHSLGALILTKAAEVGLFAALGLLAPSPPGNLPAAAAIPLVEEGEAIAAPRPGDYAGRYLGKTRDDRWHPLLTAESPRALNDRYGLRVPVRAGRLPRTGFVLEAGLEDRHRHPLGQNAAVADFLGYSHRLLPDTPHCMMLNDPGGQAFGALREALQDIEAGLSVWPLLPAAR